MRRRLNDQLRETRERAGVSLVGLAKRIGVSEKTGPNYEAGRTKPERGQLIEITRELRLDTEATNEILTVAQYDPEPVGLLAEIAARSRTRGRRHTGVSALMT